MIKHRRPLLVALGTCIATASVAVGCGDDASTSSSSSTSSTSSSGGEDSGPGSDSGPKADGGPTKVYSINATVVGLKGSGFVLQDKAGGTLPVSANGGASQKVTFPTKVVAGTAFEVTVKTQPSTPTQVCVVTGGKGSVVAADVDSITVNCTDQYTVGGTVSGLAGKNLVLENNGAQDTVTVNANGAFAFPKPLPAGAPYAVTVKTNPTDAWQTCTISPEAGAPSGTIGSANVTNIAINCVTNKYTLGVKVAGLNAASTGVVFQNNLADDLSFAADGTKNFTMDVDSGANFDITVKTSPTTPWQTCTVPAAGKAKMAGANTVIDVTCTTNTYKVGGTLTGLQGNGLVLQNNAGDDLTLNGAGANGAFSFVTKVASGMPYAVTVKTYPNTVADEYCWVTTGSGTVTNSDITTANVNCTVGKVTFITSTVYDGNLGGLAGADTKCQARATAAGLPGTYKAWLSDNTGSPSSRFTQSANPYILVDGTKLANNWGDLIDGTLLSAINKSELGGAGGVGTVGCPGASVWTNTNTNGTQLNGGSSCNNWSSTAGSSIWGQQGQLSSSWTNWCSGGTCSWTDPLYCFQQ